MDVDAVEKIVDILVKKADAWFVFIADHRKTEDLYDISYYSDMVLGEYEMRLIEKELESIAGYNAELNNLKECDCVFAAEVLTDAENVFCRNDSERNRFMASFARDAEYMQIKREIMKVRIRECGVAYEQ